MIIYTTRLPKKKFALGVVVATALCCGALTLGEFPAPFTLAWSSGQSTSVKTEAQRVDYLAQWGWQVAESPTVEELVIPTTLDQSYSQYIALQTSQGFPSLEELSGQRVKRYSYQVTNYPGQAEKVQVNLLVHGTEVVAGEVLSLAVDGFLHGLSRPTPQ